MRISALRLLLAATVFLSGCATHESGPRERSTTSYYDRNVDGQVDLEKHKHSGVADADWELRDDNYNGTYETRVDYGFAVRKSTVAIQVPTAVKIETNP